MSNNDLACEPVSYYDRVYGAARAVMRGTGHAFNSPAANEKKTVYVTRRGLFSSTTTPEQRDTWVSILMMLLVIMMFAVSVDLFAVGFLMHVIERPVRRVLELRRQSAMRATGQ